MPKPPRPLASGPAPSVDRTRARRRTALATTASIALHGAALVLLFSSATGDLIGAQAAAAGGPEPITVAVVPAAVVGLAPPPTPASTRLTPLIAENGSDAPPIVLPPEEDAESRLASLMQRVQADAARPWAQPADTPRRFERQPPTDSRRAGDRGEAAAPTRAVAEAGGAPGSTGALWGKVEPCWRNLAPRATVPVTLEIAVDRTGSVSTPPKVIRAGDAVLDERRLRSEALAVAALGGCMPRGDLSFSGRVFRLSFSPAR